MNIWAWILIAWLATNLIVGAAASGRAKKAAPAPDAGTHAVRVLVYVIIYTGLALLLLGAVGVLNSPKTSTVKFRAKGYERMKHLWEFDHPYYCSEGNFFKNGLAHRFESWAERYPSEQTSFEDLGNLLYDFDDDLNLLWRWDWKHYDREVWGEGAEQEIQEPYDVLMLFFMLQRKAYNMSAEVLVTAGDEPAVRLWLEGKAAHMVKLWDPFITERRSARTNDE